MTNRTAVTAAATGRLVERIASLTGLVVAGLTDHPAIAVVFATFVITDAIDRAGKRPIALVLDAEQVDA